MFFKKRVVLSFIVAVFWLLFATSAVFAADPTLTLSPAIDDYYVNQTMSLDIVMDSDSNSHQETYVELSFDPTQVEVQSITNKNLYYNYQDEVIDNPAGIVTLRGDFWGGSQTNDGTFATVVFKALSTSKAAINFTVSTQILDSSGSPFTSAVFTDGSYTLIASLSDATLTLDSAYPKWALNDQQEVVVTLDTQGNDVTGVDVVLTYDPTIFEYQSVNWKNNFPYQEGVSIDYANGIVTFSAVTQEGSPINSRVEVAGVVFKAIANGSADFDFDWTLGSTTDTNIVDNDVVNNDLLTSDPAAYTISVGAGALLNFQFGLLDFLGDITAKVGTLKVVGPEVTTSFSGPDASGIVLNHLLGTFSYGSLYDLVIQVQGYLKTKQSLLVNLGTNPDSGNLPFGNLTPGDVNGDGVNNTNDLFELFSYFNSDFPGSRDLNGDGRTNSFDVDILYKYFNLTDTI